MSPGNASPPRSPARRSKICRVITFGTNLLPIPTAVCRFHTILDSNGRLRHSLRPEGLGAAMYRVLDFKAALPKPAGPPFFCPIGLVPRLTETRTHHIASAWGAKRPSARRHGASRQNAQAHRYPGGSG